MGRDDTEMKTNYNITSKSIELNLDLYIHHCTW